MENGKASSPTEVLSGVPQGSVFGPLLFIVIIMSRRLDLPLTEGTELLLYADDILVYRPIKNEFDYRLLQQDLHLVTQWVNQYFLQLNPSKCKYMVISRKLHVNLTAPSINHTGYVQEFKYLGICTSELQSQLVKTYQQQVYVTRLGDCRVCCSEDLAQPSSSCETLRSLYVSYVRPHLEYAAPCIMGSLHTDRHCTH